MDDSFLEQPWSSHQVGIEQEEPESPIHWRQFIALEADLLRLSKYIEFDKRNFRTFSIELSNLLLSTGSEVDVVAKLLCKKIDPKSKAKYISHYGNQIGAALPRVSKMKVHLPSYGINLQPWTNWNSSPRKSPNWWKSYNNVKHQRDKFFPEANLGNVLNALGGLYILTLYLYREIANEALLRPNSMLFRPEKDYEVSVTWRGTDMLINYEL